MDMARKEQDTAHGTHPGDPAKAANAIIAGANSHVGACCQANDALTLVAGSPTKPGRPEG